MLIKNLLKTVSKKYQKIQISGICFDSRQVKKNFVFFTIKGKKNIGHKFINEAISLGAAAIVSERKLTLKNCQIPVIVVKNVRTSLSEACSNFYKEKPKNIIAVTGTNGKSSVANFFYQILTFNKVLAASIGTLGINSKNYNIKTKLTTMDPLFLHKNLEILVKNKVNHVILEASSHGLDQKRIDYLKLKLGIFTNISHDHLDYHKNMESYFNSKMHLFKNLLRERSTVITDEENSKFKILNNILKNKKIKKITIGKHSGNLRILNHSYKKNKQVVQFSLNSEKFDIQIPLIGDFQIKNIFMAALAALSCGLKKNVVINSLSKIKPVEGRLECIANLKNNSNIILDFAHTPVALEQSLDALKKQFKKEIILVFGCGGDRDKKKRFIMGKIANKYCKKIFITDDNPRYEDPKKIRNAIIKGCGKKAISIGSRKKAIEAAVRELEQNQILLVAGKGHEKNQNYGNKIMNFSDKKIIKNIIKKNLSLFKRNSWSQFLAKKSFANNNLKNINYNGVSIDTKTIKKNNLFFAIKGKNTDGHLYAKEAIRKGALKSVVHKKVKNLSKRNAVNVKNTLTSLNNLAKLTRENFNAQIIGVTGSVGKTTLKNIITLALANYGKVHSSPLSYNNKFGVPLSLSNLKNNIDYGVFEIGMSKKGEIDILSKIVKPDIAIITNIGEAHFGNFKNLKGIAKAKSEIINNISKNGNLILNKDCKFFNFLSSVAIKKKVNITSFSLKKKADIFLQEIKKIKKYYQLKINVKNEIFYFYTKYSTDSFISNLLACISTIYILNLNLKKIKKSFINFSLPNGRGDIKMIKKFNKRFKFIDESYNANPLSMNTAIKNIDLYREKKNYRKLVFLGDMLELGNKSKKFHRELSYIINKSNIDKVYVLGKHIKETFNGLSLNKKGKIFKNLKQAHDHFDKILHNNDLLMVKGSNATGLNRFSTNIKKGQISAI